MSSNAFLSLPLVLAISVYGAFQLSQPVLAQSTGGVLQVTPPAPDRDITSSRIVFSTVNEEVRAAKTLRLQNTGSETLTITDLSLGNSKEMANAVRTSDHQRAADYTILNRPALPLSLAAGAFVDLSIQFAPLRVATVNTAITFSSPHTINGENYAALTITSSDPARPTAVVNLAGINFADYEGVSEASMSEIARAFGWTLNIGTENSPLGCSDPTNCTTDAVNAGGDKKLFGDEVYSPSWVRADPSKPVLLWPLAAISGRTDAPHSPTRWVPQGSTGQGTLLYNFAGRDNDDNVTGSNNLSGGENQKLLPKILVNNVNSTPTSSTVDFVPSASFGLNANGAFSDDTRNGDGDLHNFRIFPVRDQRGTLVPNSWFATADPGNVEEPPKNYDYNDEIYLLVNAKPASTAVDPTIPGFLPAAPGLVYNFNQAYTGSLTDKDGQTIGFTSTQFNQNDGYTATNSFNPGLLDINTTGAGTLSITTNEGTSTGTTNTLVNGLQTTFDGRGNKFAIRARILGPLSNIATPNQQAGIVFGPNQDNFVKVVTEAQSNGTLGIQFYKEKATKGSNVSPIVTVSNPAGVRSLDLTIIGDPQADQIRATYRILYTDGSDTGTRSFPDAHTLVGGEIGHFFAAQSKASIITSHRNASSTGIVFDRFAVTRLGALGDFNNGENSDIVWRNRTTGQTSIWLMNGPSLSSSVSLPVVDTAWAASGTGDFNADGEADILWRNQETGQNVVWVMDGTNLVSTVSLSSVTDLNWQIGGAGDYNSDGKPDILWRNYATGANVVWLMNGTNFVSLVTLPSVTNLNWRISGSGFFNTDSKSDIVWRNQVTGQNTVWLMNGTSLASSVALPSVTDLNWQIGGAGDYNNDGMSDVLWRNYATGANVIWLMNGTTLTTTAALPTVSTTWQIQGPR